MPTPLRVVCTTAVLLQITEDMSPTIYVQFYLGEHLINLSSTAKCLMVTVT